MKARNDHNDIFPKQWILEASNNFAEWVTLHKSEENNNDLNGAGKQHSYPLETTEKFSIFRLTQLSSYYSPSVYAKYFVLNKFELFGKIIDLHENMKTCQGKNNIRFMIMMFCTVL